MSNLDVHSDEDVHSSDVVTNIVVGQQEHRKLKGFNWFTVGLLILSGVGTASIILRELNYGVMLSEDSPTYISAARSLLEGDGFITLYRTPYVTSAPLFPVVIASIGMVGIDVVTAAAYVNAVAFGLTVLIATMWLRNRIESRLLVLWIGCACILSVLMAESAAAAMTDTLFILFVVLSLFALDRFLETHKWSILVLAAVWTALACLTRYIGVTVLPAVWVILLTQRDISFRQKSRYFISYSIIALAPIGLWLLRNYIATGSVAGTLSDEKLSLMKDEELSLTSWSLLTGLDRAGTIFLKWAYSDTVFEYLNGLSERVLDISILQNPTTFALLIKAAILSIVVICAGYVIVWLTGKRYLYSWKPVAPSGSFILFYTLGLSIMLPATGIEFSDRYLAPIHVPILAIFTLILHEFLRSISSQWLAKASLTLLCLWLIFQTSATYNNIRVWIDEGNSYSYTSKHQADSEVMDYINSNPLIGHIYSNDSDRIYLLTDSTYSVSYDGLPDRVDDSWHGRQRWNKGDSEDAYVVMFYDRMYLWGYEVGDLVELPGMEVVAILEDGAILKRAGGAGNGSEGTFIDMMLEDSNLVTRSNFDLYINEGKNRLTYIKNECSSEDMSTLFFLHIDPTNQADLPEHRRQYTFDNHDFNYSEYGFKISKRCVILRNLPDYDITAIRTGQWVEGQGHLWEVEVYFVSR